jgi:hypothetical protein
MSAARWLRFGRVSVTGFLGSGQEILTVLHILLVRTMYDPACAQLCIAGADWIWFVDEARQRV